MIGGGGELRLVRMLKLRERGGREGAAGGTSCSVKSRVSFCFFFSVPTGVIGFFYYFLKK